MLTKEQVLFIQIQLEQSSLKQTLIKEEFLDHLCCDIETKTALGIPFHKACNDSFSAFQEGEMQGIETHFSNLNNHKQLIMKKVSALAFGLMFLATAIWAFQNEPPNRSPLEDGFKVSSSFGTRIHPINKEGKMHTGIDFVANIGTPIYATSDGIVITVEHHDSGYGNHVLIQHDKIFKTKYGQMSAIKVKVGQQVKKGDIIGLVGSSGASTGPHLHYEVWKNEKAVDPILYLKP